MDYNEASKLVYIYESHKYFRSDREPPRPSKKFLIFVNIVGALVIGVCTGTCDCPQNRGWCQTCERLVRPQFDPLRRIFYLTILNQGMVKVRTSNGSRLSYVSFEGWTEKCQEVLPCNSSTSWLKAPSRRRKIFTILI